MKLAILIASILFFLVLATPVNNGNQYYSYPTLTYTGQGYTIHYGHTLDVGKQLDIRFIGLIGVYLYINVGGDWQLVFKTSYDPYQGVHISETQKSVIRSWNSSYTFQPAGDTKNLAIVFHWWDNMNLSNWLNMPGTSEYNGTYWEHEVKWTGTFTFPYPQGNGNQPKQNDPTTTILLGGLVALGVIGVIAYYAKRKYEG